MSQDEEKRLKKEAMKEAMKEFLEEELGKRFQKLGEWLAHTIAVLLLGASVYLILKSLGWTKGA